MVLLSFESRKTKGMIIQGYLKKNKQLEQYLKRLGSQLNTNQIYRKFLKLFFQL